ncbi:hypothetical protein [Acidianus sp. HS-5]|uniref:hypothetical protein n=1 Tax=Acidianus sp. HS-5 TaxID=2886040 RepID=UPI001F40DDC9|nr:hypothetical protein [Acidianus sp. HS-5]BDC18291.1 hypothetical protein HS5_11810 [Acidianus sp. HS-5]
MNCEEELKEAVILAWVGDKEGVNKITKECIKDLSSFRSIIKEVSKIKGEVNRDFEIPKKLRDAGITTEDLLGLALLRLSRRISLTVDLKHNYDGRMIYSIIDVGSKKILRGYCKECRGFHYFLLKENIGFAVEYDKIIYAEFLQGDEKSVVSEIEKEIIR